MPGKQNGKKPKKALGTHRFSLDLNDKDRALVERISEAEEDTTLRETILKAIRAKAVLVDLLLRGKTLYYYDPEQKAYCELNMPILLDVIGLRAKYEKSKGTQEAGKDSKTG